MTTSSEQLPQEVIGSRQHGGHSMTGKLWRVMVRTPAPPATSLDWQGFGYLHPVEIEESAREHAALVELLRREIDDIIVQPEDPVGALDAIFAYDPSLMTNAGAVLLRPGKALRQQEPGLHEETYAEYRIPVLGRIEAPGTVEGGDTLWLDERTLAIGRSYRTNEEGIQQLAAILAPLNVRVLAFDLPHMHGPAECLHLMSLISPVAPCHAVVHRPLMAVSFVLELESRGWNLIDCAPEEFDSMACNVLAFSPFRCLMIEGNPITRERLEAAGCTVLTYEGNEISLNRAGGPTCLTRPIWRDQP